MLSKTSAPPLWKHSTEVSGFRPGSSRPVALAVGGTSAGAKPNPRGPRTTPGENICNMGRGSICVERGFLMKYRLLTVQEGRERAVSESSYRSAAVKTHSSSPATDPRCFYCLDILRALLKSRAYGSEIWDRWIRKTGRGLEGFIGRALVSFTSVNEWSTHVGGYPLKLLNLHWWHDVN